MVSSILIATKKIAACTGIAISNLRPTYTAIAKQIRTIWDKVFDLKAKTMQVVRFPHKDPWDLYLR